LLKIRLRRVGAKKQPIYRLVVADSRAARDGRFLETLGHYNPRTSPETVAFKEERVLYWLSVGAQPSEAVERFFRRAGVFDKLAAVRAGTPIADLVGFYVQEPGVAAEAPTEVAAPPEAIEAEGAGLEEAPAAEAEAVEAVQTLEVSPEAEGELAFEFVEQLEPEAEAAPGAEVEAAPTVEAEVLSAEDAVAAAQPQLQASRSVGELGLSPRVRKALETAGVTTIDQLAARLEQGDDAVTGLPGVGAKALEEIKAAMANQ
jgi:small subunit ribosomal protein S16